MDVLRECAIGWPGCGRYNQGCHGIVDLAVGIPIGDSDKVGD